MMNLQSQWAGLQLSALCFSTEASRMNVLSLGEVLSKILMYTLLLAHQLLKTKWRCSVSYNIMWPVTVYMSYCRVQRESASTDEIQWWYQEFNSWSNPRWSAAKLWWCCPSSAWLAQLSDVISWNAYMQHLHLVLLHEPNRCSDSQIPCAPT